MFGAMVVLWLGSDAQLAERRADISAWAHARQLHAELLRPSGASYDAALADDVEALLEEARTLPEAPGTPDALQRAERLLLEHPELPQAAWLLAERYAIEAHALAASDSNDDAIAARHADLGGRALDLEGVRAVAAGATPWADRATAQPRVPAPSGARPHDLVFIDAVALQTDSAPMLLAPGRHHVRVARGPLPVWSGWVTLEPGHVEPLPDPAPPCSALDLADVDAGSAAPAPAPGVRCGRWFVARPSSSGGLDVAECAGSRCEPWQRAGTVRSDMAAGSLEAVAPEHDGWPGWATWSLVGAGALAVTGVVLWQVGAFERDAPGTEFVFTGPSASAYRF
jgi:hypothetical protein